MPAHVARRGLRSLGPHARCSKPLSVALFVAMIVSIVAVSMTGSASAKPKAPKSTPPSAIRGPERLAPVQRAQALMQGRYRDSNAGVMLTPGQKIIVQVVPSAQGRVRAALNRIGLRAQTTVVPAKHSLTQLKNLTHQIATDARDGRLDASDIVQWGPHLPSNKVVFYLHRRDPAVVHRLQERYGSSWVQVSPQTRPWPHKTDRHHDTPPYWGGDGVWKNGDSITNDCTSGFAVIGRKTRYTYMLLAGHCYQVGDKVDTNFSDPQTMGVITNRRYVYGGLDAEAISGSYSPRVWTADSNSATVIGSGDIPPNEGQYSLVTVNGGVTGEHRRLLVTDANQCESYLPEYTCYITVVSGFAVEGGDSGGPVYQYSSSGQPNVFAAGTIDGSDTATNETFVEQIIDEENYFTVDIDTG